ncbi:MAG: hypothetical protein V3V08_01005 [Nannocystaceae bacterium]
MPLRKILLLSFLALASTAEVWVLADSGQAVRLARREQPCAGSADPGAVRHVADSRRRT